VLFRSELGAWALDAACKQLGEWRRQGLGRVGVSVNVSIHQFYQQDFAEYLRQTLERHGVDPSQLMLEITESIASNADLVVVQLERLKSLGVSVALDDFGTGYSSLQYLQRYPIDCVKIDRSFVADMEGNEADRTLVATIISLAHSLGLRTVAEGVESPTQLALLRELGADLLQGTYFAEALDAGAAGEWIAHRATTHEESPRG
jgi:EAL domain-containing protein (putative c-di-GMP-specific phosphodiesterase class I)